MSRFIGGAFGVAATASVFASFGGFASPELFTDGLRAVIWSMTAMTAAGALAAMALPLGVRQVGTLATKAV